MVAVCGGDGFVGFWVTDFTMCLDPMLMTNGALQSTTHGAGTLLNPGRSVEYVMYSSAFSVFLVNFSSWLSSTDLRFLININIVNVDNFYRFRLLFGPVNHFPRQRTAEVAR